MDMERLKNNGIFLIQKYFEEQLERIREIRISGHNFYQKLTDIYAAAIDYDKNAKLRKSFLQKFRIRCTMRFINIHRLN